MPLKPSYLLLIGAGGIVAYSGFKGKGIGAAVRALIAGQNPQTVPQSSAIVTASYSSYGYGSGTGSGSGSGSGTGSKGSGGAAPPPPSTHGHGPGHPLSQPAPANLTGNRAIGFALVTAAGWASQWSAFNSIVMSESGWNNRIWNGGSTSPTRPSNSDGGYGIPQATPFNKMPKAAWPPGYGGSASASAQISWMIGYIRSVYGDPNRAWAHHQAVGTY